jgi:putative ABC transport system permease protein
MSLPRLLGSGLARLLSSRNLKNDRFGAIAGVLGVAVGAAMVNVVAILDVNTTRIEASFAEATGPRAQKAGATVQLAAVREGVRIEPAPEKATSDDAEVLRTGIRLGSLSAFLLGALIVFFTFSAIIDRRLRELALLRSLGALPAQLSAIFLREAGLIGLAGGALGFVASIPTAYLAAGAGVTTTGHLKIDPRGMSFPWATMLLISALGAAVAVLGALHPLRAVARIEIGRALRPRFLPGVGTAALPARRRLLRLVAAPLLLAAMLLLRPLAERALAPLAFHALEALGTCLAFVAALLLVPDLVRWLGAALVRLVPGGTGAERLLTRRRIEHQGHELSWSVMGVMLVFSLLLTLHLVTHGLKDEVRRWSDVALNDETFVLPWYPDLRADSLTASLPPGAVVLRLSGRTPWPNALHAAEHAELVRFAEDTGRPELVELARRLGPGKILLSTLMARRYQLREGDALEVSGPRATRRLTVAAVSDALGFTPMNAAHRKARTYGLIDATDGDLLAPWADPLGAVAVVAHASDPAMTRWRGDDAGKLTTRRGIYLMTARFYRDLRLREASSDFVIFDLLLALTSLLAAVGIASQLVLSVRARQGELALYRALGMSAAQLRRLVVMEGAFIGLLGGCLAALLGVPLGATALGALRGVSGFEVRLSLPLSYLLFTVLGSTLIATLASLYPATRAAKSGAAESVHHE